MCKKMLLPVLKFTRHLWNAILNLISLSVKNENFNNFFNNFVIYLKNNTFSTKYLQFLLLDDGM